MGKEAALLLSILGFLTVITAVATVFASGGLPPKGIGHTTVGFAANSAGFEAEIRGKEVLLARGVLADYFFIVAYTPLFATLAYVGKSPWIAIFGVLGAVLDVVENLTLVRGYTPWLVYVSVFKYAFSFLAILFATALFRESSLSQQIIFYGMWATGLVGLTGCGLRLVRGLEAASKIVGLGLLATLVLVLVLSFSLLIRAFF